MHQQKKSFPCLNLLKSVHYSSFLDSGLTGIFDGMDTNCAGSEPSIIAQDDAQTKISSTRRELENIGTDLDELMAFFNEHSGYGSLEDAVALGVISAEDATAKHTKFLALKQKYEKLEEQLTEVETLQVMCVKICQGDSDVAAIDGLLKQCDSWLARPCVHEKTHHALKILKDYLHIRRRLKEVHQECPGLQVEQSMLQEMVEAGVCARSPLMLDIHNDLCDRLRAHRERKESITLEFEELQASIEA